VAIHEAVWIATGLKALAMTSLMRYARSFINVLQGPRRGHSERSHHLALSEFARMIAGGTMPRASELADIAKASVRRLKSRLAE
jgi:hypothetical protein